MRIFKTKMYCEPLRSRSKNKQLIQNFTIDREADCIEYFKETGKICGLELYLKYCAWKADERNEVKVYLVKTYFTEEIVAYFALKAGMLSVDDEARDKEREANAIERGIKLVPDTIPGIEISHFAVNDIYRRKHKNVRWLGGYIYPTFIYPIFKKFSEFIGVKVVYLYAADNSNGSEDNEKKKHLVDYYREAFKFSEATDTRYIPVTSYYDDNCIFMYQVI